MPNKDNREVWRRLFNVEDNGDNKNPDNKKNKESETKILAMFMSIAFGLTSLTLVILLIVFLVIGDSFQNLMMLGIVSVVCILVFISCMCLFRKEKAKEKSKPCDESSSQKPT